MSHNKTSAKVLRSDVLRYARRTWGGQPYISTVLRKHFLVLAFPKTSRGEWEKNGVPVTFKYMERSTVANGGTWKSLLRSAKFYRRFQTLPREQGMRLLLKTGLH